VETEGLVVAGSTWEADSVAQWIEPYRVEARCLAVMARQAALLVFGKAANTLFGTVSSDGKRRIGAAITAIH
jgi:hypothetical protein